MKSVTLVLLSLGFTVNVSAQNISNPSFDSVYFGGIDRVLSWITSDGMSFYAGFNSDTVNPLMPNTTYSSAGLPFSESYDAIWTTNSPYSNVAVILNTKPNYRKNTSDWFETFIVNGNEFKTDSDGYLDLSSCGEPFPYRPTKLKGKYQFIDTLSLTQNSGKCVVMLKKYNTSTGLIDTVAYDTYNLSNFPITTTWQGFELPINYWSTDLPDSIIIAFYASQEPNANAQFIVDDLSFVYGPASIAEPTLSFNKLHVFPNPATDFIYTNDLSNEFYDYKLIGLDGTILKKGICSNYIPIDELKFRFLILELTAKDGQRQIFKVVTTN